MEYGTINESMVGLLAQRTRVRPSVVILVITFPVYAILMIYVAIWYNHMTYLYQQMTTGKAQIDVAVQYRQNLFPLLVEATARFVKHEDRVFDYTTDKRTDALRQASPSQEEIEGVANMAKSDWQSALGRIMAWAENYPDLKTSVTFQTMMTQMSLVEQEVATRRHTYNQASNVYTTAAHSFPTNAVSRIFGFVDSDFVALSGESEWNFSAQPTAGPSTAQPTAGLPAPQTPKDNKDGVTP